MHVRFLFISAATFACANAGILARQEHIPQRFVRLSKMNITCSNSWTCSTNLQFVHGSHMHSLSFLWNGDKEITQRLEGESALRTKYMTERCNVNEGRSDSEHLSFQCNVPCWKTCDHTNHTIPFRSRMQHSDPSKVVFQRREGLHFSFMGAPHSFPPFTSKCLYCSTVPTALVLLQLPIFLFASEYSPPPPKERELKWTCFVVRTCFYSRVRPSSHRSYDFFGQEQIQNPWRNWSRRLKALLSTYTFAVCLDPFFVFCLPAFLPCVSDPFAWILSLSFVCQHSFLVF